jgi:hypothetical protein
MGKRKIGKAHRKVALIRIRKIKRRRFKLAKKRVSYK